MQLLLRVQYATDATRDLAIEVEPQATVRDLAASLADQLVKLLGPAEAARAGLSPAGDPNAHVPRLYREATGDRLDPQSPVGATGLISGDVVWLDAQPPSRSAAQEGWQVAVLNGPLTGRTYALPDGPGPFTVGNDPLSHVPLPDPTVSAAQLTLEVLPDGAGIRVTPAARVTNAVLVDGRPCETPTLLGDPGYVQVGSTVFAVRRAVPGGPRRDLLGQVPFNRVPYRLPVIQDRALGTLTDIPARPEQRPFSWFPVVLPLAGGVVIAGLTGQATFLLLTLIAPLAVAANWLEGRRTSRRQHDQDSQDLHRRIEERHSALTKALEAERVERLRAAPDVAELKDRAELHAPTLWCRGRDTDDFLVLRAGLGTQPPKVTIGVDEHGDPDLRAKAAEKLTGPETTTLRSVPVTLDLAALGTAALVGDTDTVTRIAITLTLQAAALHSPEDLVIVCAAHPRRQLAEQLQWLPHTRTLTSPVDAPHVVGAGPPWTELCAELSDVAEQRAGDATDRETRWPWILVVLDELLDPDRAQLARLLDVCPQAGISMLWLGTSADQVPRQARAVLHCSTTSAVIDYRTERPERTALDLEPLDPDAADRAVRALAPLRDNSAASQTTAIPKTVPLFTALGLTDPAGEVEDSHPAADRPDPDVSAVDRGHRSAPPSGRAQRLLRQWNAGDRTYRVQSPLGMQAGGPFVLDFVEQGPHVLIGGTSGSGKSELLVAMVAGLMNRHSPRRLTVLLIDYKGGAASAVFQNAPHCVGYVTNLDGNLADRALISLRAELDERMRLLKKHGQKDLRHMLKKLPDLAPPSLVIVVDEFATLGKEVPGFLPGIVDIAQRGRSLGIHLVLATQRPSGAVNENILANTNARISLRMIDAADSSSVIGTPAAADIPVPLRGRALARLGGREVIEFQSAFGGAPLTGDGQSPIEVTAFSPCMTTAAEREKRDDDTDSPPEPEQIEDQLHGFLTDVASAFTASELATPNRPWLDPLPPVVTLAELLNSTEKAGWLTQRAPLSALLSGEAAGTGWVLPLGRVDDPAHQRQYPAAVDLEEGGGLLVLGGAAAGKTTVLRTLAAAAVMTAPAHGVVLFALDFASRALQVLASLPICAAVATGDDLEAVTRVLARLDGEVRRRRRVLAGAESLTAHLAARGSPLPRILLLVDGYPALRDTFLGSGVSGSAQVWLDVFHRIVIEGRTVGVHTVLTADRAGAVAPAVASTVSRRLVLQQADERGWADAGVPIAVARTLENLPPGGGLLDGRLLAQVAAFTPPTPPDPPGPDVTAEPPNGHLSRQPGPADTPPLTPAAPLLPRQDHIPADDSPPTAPDGQPGGDPTPGEQPPAPVDGRAQTLALQTLAADRSGHIPPELVTDPLAATEDLPPTAERPAATAVIGVADVTRAPVLVPLDRDGLIVVGPRQSGRSTALAALAASLHRTGCELYAVGTAQSPLRDRLRPLQLPEEQLAFTWDRVQHLVDRVLQEAQTRPGLPRILLIDDAARLLSRADAELFDPLADTNGVQIVTALDPSSLTSGYFPTRLMERVKNERRRLLLQPDDLMLQTALGVRFALRPGLTMPRGRGVLYTGGTPVVVHIGRFKDSDADTANSADPIPGEAVGVR